MNHKNPIGKMELLLSRQTLDYASLGVILDQIKNPCLILDKLHNKILQVNSELILLTGFTREELCQVKADSLINDLNLKNEIEEKKTVEIKRKNKPSIKCLSNLISLNSQGSLMLMAFYSVNTNNKNLVDKNSFLQLILDLVLLSENKPIDEYLNHIINKLKNIYDCSNICIYISDDASQKLLKKKTTEPTQIFPNEILLSEISLTRNMDIWKPGKRVLTDIQRAARINGTTLLIQVFLNINENIKGVIILSSKDELDSEKTYEQLPLLAQIIEAVLGKKYKEKNNIQKALEKNNRALLLDSILCNIKMGISVINKEGKIIETNFFLEQMLGFSKWEMVNNTAQSILPNFLFKTKKKENEFQDIKKLDLPVNLHRRDGSEFPAQLQFLPLSLTPDPGEDAITLLIINDLSQIEQLNTKNKQLERQADIGVLVASFAHDVRNVFNSIKLNAETVELKSSAEKSIQEYAENIKEDCDRINQLMESVLSFSSSIEDNMQSLDIPFLLQRLIERWNPKLEKTKIKSILQFEKEIPRISADPRSLEQVFNNLFSNARDAMNRSGGTLGVYISKKEQGAGLSYVIIKISDSGPGIPEESLTRIFDPYFSSRPGGTGLGLAITKRIVELHHGKIEVESFPGGTTFIVTLPEKIMEIIDK